MWTKCHRLYLFRHLVVNPCIDNVFCEYIALQQKIVIALESVQCVFEISVLMVYFSVLQDSNHKYPCRADRPDQVCSKFRPILPSSKRKKQDTGCRIHPASGIQPALLSGFVNMREFERTHFCCAEIRKIHRCLKSGDQSFI